MADDWKLRIDDYDEKQKNEQQNKEDLDKQRLIAQGIEEQSEYQSRLNDLRNELAKKFFCHICMRPSQKPGKDISWSGNGEHTPQTPIEIDDWSRPGDLAQCNICHLLTCEEHLYKGICKTCAEKL